MLELTCCFDLEKDIAQIVRTQRDPDIKKSKKFTLQQHTGCPNKMLTLFDRYFLQLFKTKGTWYFIGCQEEELSFRMKIALLKSVSPIKSYDA